MTAMEIFSGTEDATIARREGRKELVRGALAIFVIAILATTAGWLPGRIFVVENDLPARLAVEYAAGRLKQGEIPLWNPDAMLGGPLIGDGRTGVFFPTILLHMILPATWAWTIAGVVKLWLAGFGAVVIGRRLGFSALGATFGGAVFMLSGLCAGSVNSSAMNALPLLPWAMLVAGALYEKLSAARLVGATFFFLVVFFGADEGASLAVGLAAFAYLGWCFVNEPKAPGRLVGAALTLIASAAVAWAVAAVHWWPAHENAQYTGTNLFVWADVKSRWLAAWVGVTPLLLAIFAAVKSWRSGRVLFWLIMIFVSMVGMAATGRMAMLGPGVLGVALMSGEGIAMVRESMKDRSPRLTPALMAVAVVELLAVGIFLNRGSPVETAEKRAALKWVEEQAGDAAFRVMPLSPAVAAPRRTLDWLAEIKDVNHPAMRLLGVKYLISDKPPEVLPPSTMRAAAAPVGRLFGRTAAAPLGPMKWKAVYPSTQPAGLAVYENVAQPLARFWIARSAEYLSSAKDALERVKKGDFDPHEVVIVDRELAAEFGESGILRRPQAMPGRGNLQLLEDSPERIRIATEGAGGWLVLADAYAPGWVGKMSYTVYQRTSRRGPPAARSYERELTVVPAYGALRAVALQGGAEVVFEYEPKGWRNGLLVASIGGIVLLILIGGMMFPRQEEPEILPKSEMPIV